MLSRRLFSLPGVLGYYGPSCSDLIGYESIPAFLWRVGEVVHSSPVGVSSSTVDCAKGTCSTSLNTSCLTVSHCFLTVERTMSQESCFRRFSCIVLGESQERVHGRRKALRLSEDMSSVFLPLLPVMPSCIQANKQPQREAAIPLTFPSAFSLQTSALISQVVLALPVSASVSLSLVQDH